MIKVAIFDDNQSRREGLQLLIDAMEDMSWVNCYPDCTNIILNLSKDNPDVVLMDINMPNVDGIEGVRQIKAHLPKIKVIMQTIFEEESKILEAICAGADGYIIKHKSPMRLIDGISEVLNGGAPMTPTIANKVLKLCSLGYTKSNFYDFGLTSREKEILGLLVDGYSYKIIAGMTHISYATVNKHISNIYAKLQVNSASAAVSKAIKEGLIR